MMLMPDTRPSLKIATSVKQEYQQEPGALRLSPGLMWYAFMFSKEKQKKKFFWLNRNILCVHWHSYKYLW